MGAFTCRPSDTAAVEDRHAGTPSAIHTSTTSSVFSGLSTTNTINWGIKHSSTGDSHFRSDCHLSTMSTVCDADLLKTSRSKGGVTNVETITITITTVKTLFEMILVMPALATINPTSPREIMPTPTRNDRPTSYHPLLPPTRSRRL